MTYNISMSFYSILLNIVLLIFGAMAVLVALEYFIRFQQKRHSGKEVYTTLLIRVARDNETGPIVAEQIFSTIHGISQSLSFFDRLRGKSQTRVSFEIASVNRSIRFYAHFPTRLRNLIEGQVYAQYPNVEITEVQDYSVPNPLEVSEAKAAEDTLSDVKALVNVEKAVQKAEKKQFMAVDEFQHAIGAELALSSLDIFPIKRYSQFEDKKAKVSLDPLSAITSTLAKFNDPDEQAWIQVVVAPLDDKWRGVFNKCIRILSQGIYMNIAKFQGWYAKAYCTRSRIVRILFFPVYWIFALQGIQSGAPSDSGGGDAPSDISKVHDRESPLEGAADKVGKLMYEANVRIVYVPKHANKDVALVKLREIAGSFKQFSTPQINGFIMHPPVMGKEIVRRYHEREMIDPFVLSVEELATIYHLPNITVTTPNIYWVRSRRLEPPADLPTQKTEGGDVTLLGRTNYRGIGVPFGIKTLDRRRHAYIIVKRVWVSRRF